MLRSLVGSEMCIRDSPYSGTTLVTAGEVTEIYIPLVPIPDTGVVTFKSEPNSARVIIAGGNFSNINTGLRTEIKDYLESFEGTADEASLGIKNMVGAETCLLYTSPSSRDS